jgi:hypothetical protein
LGAGAGVTLPEPLVLPDPDVIPDGPGLVSRVCGPPSGLGVARGVAGAIVPGLAPAPVWPGCVSRVVSCAMAAVPRTSAADVASAKAKGFMSDFSASVVGSPIGPIREHRPRLQREFLVLSGTSAVDVYGRPGVRRLRDSRAEPGNWARLRVITTHPRENAMAKGQMRSTKEKKKPKADKDKKKGTSAYAMAYGSSKQPAAPLGGANPFGKKE